MSRLSEDILANIDIVDVVSKYVNLKRVGRNFVGLSPFRAEKTPSFTVSPEKQIFKCFSTGIGGNVFKFLMEMERIDFWDAAQLLAKQAGIDVAQYQTARTPQAQEKREQAGQEKEKFKLMMRIAQQFFSDELTKSAMASEYVSEKRKLSPEIVQLRGVGYAPDASYALPKLLAQKGFTEDDCIAAWLAKKSQTSGDMYGFYRNRITFPIHDHMGNLVGFGARAINPEDQPKYLNSSDSVLYDKSKILYGLDKAKSHLATHDKIVVVEGYMDVIAWSRLGMPIAVGTCGTSLTPQHLKLLKRYTSNVFFLFDNDPAGQQATVRALKLAYQTDAYPKLLILPAGFKDVDEWANVTPSQEEIDAVFTDAVDGCIGLIDRSITGYDMQNPVERKRFLQTIFDVLLAVQDWTVLSWYLEHLAKKVSVSYDILFGQFKTYTKSQTVVLAHARKEQERATATIKEDDVRLFQSFFYGTFLQDQWLQDEKLDAVMMQVVELAGVIDDDAFLQIVSGDIADTELLLQAQLWWEKHREGLLPEKKIAEIDRHCRAYIQNALKQVIKMQNLTAAEKQELIGRMRTG